MHSNYVFFGLNIGRVRAPNPGYTKLIFSGKSIENTVKKKEPKTSQMPLLKKVAFVINTNILIQKLPYLIFFLTCEGHGSNIVRISKK